MPQIDVYIFRFFPFFIFFIFILVYLYVYFIMLPNVVGVLKFRIKYTVNLNNDLVKLKRSELKSHLFLVRLYSFCNKFSLFVNYSLKSAYDKQFIPIVSAKNNILKLVKL